MYVKYLYGGVKNIADPKALIGARITIELDNMVKYEEVFIGQRFDLPNFLDLKDALSIQSDNDFIEREYYSRNAIGIIYFPNVQKFSFLCEADKVVSSYEELIDYIESCRMQEQVLKRER